MPLKLRLMCLVAALSSAACLVNSAPAARRPAAASSRSAAASLASSRATLPHMVLTRADPSAPMGGRRPGDRPRAKDAVWRILNIEGERIISALEHNWRFFTGEKELYAWQDPHAAAGVDPTSMPIDVISETKARLPIIRWSLDRWLARRTGIDLSVQLAQLAELVGDNSLSTPGLGSALRALRPELTAQVVKGMRTSPLRVVRLLYRGGQLWVMSCLMQVPGPWRAWVQRVWPSCVDHLAATLEENHRDTLGTLGAEQTTVGSAARGLLAEIRGSFGGVVVPASAAFAPAARHPSSASPPFDGPLRRRTRQRTILRFGSLKLVREEEGNAFFTTDRAEKMCNDAELVDWMFPWAAL